MRRKIAVVPYPRTKLCISRENIHLPVLGQARLNEVKKPQVGIFVVMWYVTYYLFGILRVNQGSILDLSAQSICTIRFFG